VDSLGSNANPNSAPGHPVVFWMLLVMGAAVFAPCVLLPEWREYQAVRLSEDREAAKVKGMEAVVDRQRQLLEGLQSDPAVIARIAQRDLHFHRPGDGAVYVGSLDSQMETVDPRLSPDGEMNESLDSEPGAAGDADFFDDSAIALDSDAIDSLPEPKSIEPPKYLQPYLARLPAFNYDAIFCDPQARPMVMGLSVALIAAAVLIYSQAKLSPPLPSGD